MFRIICGVNPRVDLIRLGVALKPEYLYNPIPYGLALKRLRHWYASQVFGLRFVQVMNHFAQLLNVRHAEASSSSRVTFHCDCSTPIAGAGVVRIVLCRFTKL